MAAKWDAIFKVRKAVTEALEVERREKRIGSSLEAAVDVNIGLQVRISRPSPARTPAEIFITSGARLDSDRWRRRPAW